ncbi:hypothetical protein R1sor_022624 [Riccia sorocarpa]|uniref:Uncharacterized protein n=1 Tax=Riccia sorocarpa TaxID=122646 RepID=A0ABD3GKF7_9MARC
MQRLIRALLIVACRDGEVARSIGEQISRKKFELAAAGNYHGFPCNGRLSFLAEGHYTLEEMSAEMLWVYVMTAAVLISSQLIPVAESACKPRLGCSAGLAYYKLVDNDNLIALSNRFMTTLEEVQRYNNIPSTSSVQKDQMVLFPFPCECTDNNLGFTFFYTVQLGDSLDKIAENLYQNLATKEMIREANSQITDTTLPQGYDLKVPVNCYCGDPGISPDYGLFVTYPVRQGDNVSGLAEQFQAGEQTIEKFNPSVNWNSLSTANDIVYIPYREYATGQYPAYNFSADVNGSSNKGSNVGIIVGASVGGAIGLVLVVLLSYLFCVYWPRRTKDPISKPVLVSSGSAEEGSGYSRIEMDNKVPLRTPLFTDFTVDKSVEYSFEELEEATNKFSAANKIGEGGYGSVYFANLRGQKLAVKKMNLQATREFLAELQVLTRVHHTNLVQLVGYCTVGSLFLVYEYVENGTLDRHLHRRTDLPPLSWSSRVQIALDSARGLEYIHEHTKPTYIHRDVKSSNILIDNQFHAKVADFGLTKLTESGGGSLPTRLVGTFGYMSPEYARFGDVSPKADVYSFGVVLFEIISGKEAIVRMTGISAVGAAPYREEQKGLVTLFDDILTNPDGKEKLRRLVDPGLGDNYPLESAWKMAQLAGACTQEKPERRPTMRTVVVALMTLSSTTQDWEMHAYGSDRLTTGLVSGR